MGDNRQYGEFPWESLRLLLRSSFAELRGYHDLTPQERAAVTPEAFAVLDGWAKLPHPASPVISCCDCHAQLRVEVPIS